MNKETLDKINGLLKRIECIEYAIKQAEDKFRLRIVKPKYIVSGVYDLKCSDREAGYFDIPKDIIKPAIVAYLNKLKAELKELGYEE